MQYKKTTLSNNFSLIGNKNWKVSQYTVGEPVRKQVLSYVAGKTEELYDSFKGNFKIHSVVLINVWQLVFWGKKKLAKKPWCAVFADFLGETCPTMDNFRILSWNHWIIIRKRCTLAHAYIVFLPYSYNKHK